MMEIPRQPGGGAKHEQNTRLVARGGFDIWVRILHDLKKQDLVDLSTIRNPLMAYCKDIS